MDKYKETYEALSAALALHQAVELARADGKIDLADIGFLMSPLMKLPAAIQDAEKVVGELKSMAPADRDELSAKLALEYDIPNDQLEAKVEAAVEWVLATGKLVGALTVKPA